MAGCARVTNCRPKAQLIEHYGVARMTVRSAIRLLQDEGLVVSEHGKGVYVRRRPPRSAACLGSVRPPSPQEGKAAFTVEAEQVRSVPTVDRIEVYEARSPA